jgi:hypothetical protein
METNSRSIKPIILRYLSRIVVAKRVYSSSSFIVIEILARIASFSVWNSMKQLLLNILIMSRNDGLMYLRSLMRLRSLYWKSLVRSLIITLVSSLKSCSWLKAIVIAQDNGLLVFAMNIRYLLLSQILMMLYLILWRYKSIPSRKGP